MNPGSIALIALAVGLVIGVGLSAIIAWARRSRVTNSKATSAEVPHGAAEVLDGMDDAACVVDASGLVLATSPAAARYGIAVGAGLENGEFRELVRVVRASGIATTETVRLSRSAVSLDPRLVSARASVLGGRLVLLILRDITEQERLEQVRRDFVANTSHELKTPVGAVILLAEAIESAADDPDQVRDFAARISAEAIRLGQLTRRIMSLSRLQASDGVTETEPVSIDEVVAASIEAHAVQAESAGVELIRGGDRRAFVRGDAQILIEAVGNLIANAIAYSPAGSRVGAGVKIDGETVEIAISDQGIGIDEADRERIFERFYRADDARSRRTGGTGLGLSIVKHATQRHGGEVRLWSRPGRGSTFTIVLPRIDGPAGQDEKKAKKKNKKKKHARKGSATAEDARVRNGENA
ncbi:cell wall metabolism sensor histidine kinase WalK [Microbacterium paludicola]|uniref:sensor histidine kinase n=1 Tax=Microbacterium paludicola TaxID=300019 RepID=UPI0011A823A3|nr:ATP-binding protein [Microbacterium paludicola]